jgi:integrase
MATSKKKRGAGEGSIFEEKPGKWVASITAGYEFKDGKRRRIRKKFSAPTRREVQEKLTAALRSQQTGYDIAPQSQTVGQFLTYWVDHVIPGATKPKTEEFYRYIVATHLIPTVGKIQIQKLSPQHVQALINDRSNTTKQPRAKKPPKVPASAAPGTVPIEAKKLSPQTVRQIHRTLCTALEMAVKYGAVQRNVATLVDPPRSSETADEVSDCRSGEGRAFRGSR